MNSSSFVGATITPVLTHRPRSAHHSGRPAKRCRARIYFGLYGGDRSTPLEQAEKRPTLAAPPSGTPAVLTQPGFRFHVAGVGTSSRPAQSIYHDTGRIAEEFCPLSMYDAIADEDGRAYISARRELVVLTSTRLMKSRAKATHPGQRLLELRQKRKWTQEQVAFKSGLTVRTIRNIERGTTEPDRIHPETYERLAKIFGVPVEELDPRCRRQWLSEADVTPEQLHIIEGILSLPADRLAAVEKVLKRLRTKKE